MCPMKSLGIRTFRAGPLKVYLTDITHSSLIEYPTLSVAMRHRVRSESGALEGHLECRRPEGALNAIHITYKKTGKCHKII